MIASTVSPGTITVTFIGLPSRKRRIRSLTVKLVAIHCSFVFVLLGNGDVDCMSHFVLTPFGIEKAGRIDRLSVHRLPDTLRVWLSRCCLLVYKHPAAVCIRLLVCYFSVVSLTVVI